MKHETCPLIEYVGYLAVLPTAKNKRWRIEKIFEKDGNGADFRFSIPRMVIEMLSLDSPGEVRRIEADTESIFFQSDARCMNVGTLNLAGQIITLLHCAAENIATFAA